MTLAQSLIGELPEIKVTASIENSSLIKLAVAFLIVALIIILFRKLVTKA